MSEFSDRSDEKAGAVDTGVPVSQARTGLSAWSVAAFVCVGLTVLAGIVGWAMFSSIRQGLHENDPIKLLDYFASMFAGALLFFCTPILALIGTVCAWLGLRRQPISRGLAIIALVLNLIALCLCALSGLLALGTAA